MIGLNLGSAREKEMAEKRSQRNRKEKERMDERNGGKKMETVECVELFEPFSQNNLRNYIIFFICHIHSATSGPFLNKNANCSKRCYAGV